MSQLSPPALSEEQETVVGILEGALARFEEPEHWTKGRMAGLDPLISVSPRDSCAVSWCLAGAIMAEAFKDNPHGSVWNYHALRATEEFQHYQTAVFTVAREFESEYSDKPEWSQAILTDWNDDPERTIEEVRELLATTIEKVTDHA